MRRVTLFLFSLLFGTSALAQDTCEVADRDALIALLDVCADSPAQTACNLDGVMPLSQADDIETPLFVNTGAVRALVWGHVAMETAGAVESAEVITLDASNQAGFNVNLRGGPGRTYDVVGIFRYDETAVADGRSADDLWVRLQTTEGLAWISSSLVRLDGSLDALPVVEGEADVPVAAVEVTFQHQSTDCDDDRGWLLAWGDEGGKIALSDWMLGVERALLHAVIAPDDVTLHAIDGTATIDEMTLEAGDSVRLSAEDANDTPFLSVAALQSLPIMQPIEGCYVGTGADSDSLMLWDAPASEDALTVNLAAALLAVDSTQAAGDVWWQVQLTPERAAWVSASDVGTFGNCAPVERVPPTSAPAPTGQVSTSPDETMMIYLRGLVDGDAVLMQQVSCAAWDATAGLQAQSFAAANAQLEGAACQTVSETADEARVQCAGKIVTEYNGEFRDWPLGTYRFVIEGGAWRMCGEVG